MSQQQNLAPSIDRFHTPQLRHLHSGKVRESFRVDDHRRLLVVTDRISCFDQLLETPIPDKGAVLNGIAAYWFEQTRDLCPSHFIEMIDPCASLVAEAEPLRVEVIVRGYLTGSAWRGYEAGKREFSGVRLPDGLSCNQRFPEPILTPTTKEANDREISPDEIISSGLATAEQWTRMAELALALYQRGNEILQKRNVLLVDTKYEFGLIDNNVVLIDEIHTPDSSRFWYADSYAADPLSVIALDKEFVRQWLLVNRSGNGSLPRRLPPEVLAESRQKYLDLHRTITGQDIPQSSGNPRDRLAENLARHGLIRDGFVTIVMGSSGDKAFAQQIVDALEPYDIAVIQRILSAHKTGDGVVQLARELNATAEPGAVIAVAGRSNGLGGALAANLALPVINCPPFKDLNDYAINIHSSLQMPSNAPAMTILTPKAAAQAAIRCLNRPRLRDLAVSHITNVRETLAADDRSIRAC